MLGIQAHLSISKVLFVHIHIFREAIRWDVQILGKLKSDLKQTIIRPVTEPINDTTIKESGRAR